jgi:hypothetical protein
VMTPTPMCSRRSIPRKALTSVRVDMTTSLRAHCNPGRPRRTVTKCASNKSRPTKLCVRKFRGMIMRFAPLSSGAMPQCTRTVAKNLFLACTVDRKTDYTRLVDVCSTYLREDMYNRNERRPWRRDEGVRPGPTPEMVIARNSARFQDASRRPRPWLYL